MKNSSYALITGGSSGIGYELARLFAADGWNLILVARNATELSQVKKELSTSSGVEVVTIAKDLFYPERAKELTKEIATMGFEVEVLVNDAGQGLYGLFTETELERELDIIRLNIESLVILTKFYLKKMVARGRGKILNLSSVASKIPGPWQSVYHGTKAFVQSFTEAVRSEVHDEGVTVTALLPGPTDTDFFRKAEMENAKNIKEGKLADAADVAKDGYEALMAGKDKVISGFKNKIQVAMANITPDAMAADQMKKQQAPADDNE
jgi:uncharacterized protein